MKNKSLIIILLVTFTFITSFVTSSFAVVPVSDLWTEISTAISSVKNGLVVENGYVQTGLQEVRNATAVKDAMAAYKQFQNYESTYEKVDQFAGAIYGVANGAGDVESDLSNIRNLVDLTPSNEPITPNGDLMNYINGDIGSDINIMNPNNTLDGSNNATNANNTYTFEQGLGNEFINGSDQDSIIANLSDKVASTNIAAANHSNPATSAESTAVTSAQSLVVLGQLLRDDSTRNAYTAMKLHQDEVLTNTQDKLFYKETGITAKQYLNSENTSGTLNSNLTGTPTGNTSSIPASN